jgi:hypothetical protein
MILLVLNDARTERPLGVALWETFPCTEEAYDLLNNSSDRIRLFPFPSPQESSMILVLD